MLKNTTYHIINWGNNDDIPAAILPLHDITERDVAIAQLFRVALNCPFNKLVLWSWTEGAVATTQRERVDGAEKTRLIVEVVDQAKEPVPV
jgi:hypothetical protein